MGDPFVDETPELTRLYLILNEVSELLGFRSSIVTLEGRECVSLGEVRVCSEFHKGHAASGRTCRTCMAGLGTYASSRNSFVFLCPHRLWRVAVPIIIRERHVATLLGPPFFRSEEEQRSGYFLAMAQRYGYRVRDYSDALMEVPIFSEAEVERARKGYIVLAHFLSYGLTLSHRSATEARERKKVEGRLKRSEDILRTAFEHTGTAMAVVRDDGFLLHANTQFGEILGEDSRLLRGRRWTSFVDPDRRQVLDGIHRCRKEDPVSAPDRYEVVLRRADGKEVEVLLTVGKIPGRSLYLLSLQDISERRKMEVLRKEALDQIDRNFTQLASLNDRIRNPLSVIVGLAEMGDNEFSEQVIQHAREIDSLVSDLDQCWLDSGVVRRFLKKYYDDE
ncbi:PAS domain S-box protein [Methanofollis formosanus]|uniref:PAS domain S-box protein n=1 Tax=Methanofollis formosanus TaxID=299308 RepID=A0A8G0ZZV8_9EURY|nr:PocR ligand-binding domain-containing protein [Methanofollis formosanus]QYZ78485.1 PAS domain S-box protein [Methanofollis formosanus]